MKHRIGLLSVVTAIMSSAYAQGQALEEVIVTAQKRAESVQDTPISIAAFSNAALEKMNISAVTDIADKIPNVMLPPHPVSRTAITPFIRGIGSIDNQITKDPAVGVYLDGVYLGRTAGMSSDLADLERVEVLRGPQGTLYGRNTTGGAINMISAGPESELGFQQQISVGNRDYWRSRTTLNLPVTDTLAARLSYARSSKNGWVRNIGPGQDFSEEDREGGRVALRWSPLDNLTVDYSYDRSRVTGGMAAYQVVKVGAGNAYEPYARPRRAGTLSVGEGHDGVNDRSSGHALTINWDVSDQLTLKSITSHRELQANSYFNYSASVNYLNRVNPPASPVQSLLPRNSELFDNFNNVDQSQWSQEFQAIGDAMNGRLEYVGGLYYFKERGTEDNLPYLNNNIIALNANGLPDPFYGQLATLAMSAIDTKAKAESMAVYGQLSYRPQLLQERLKLTLGLRYTRDDREATKRSISYDPGLRDSADTGLILDDWQQTGKTDSSKFTPSLIVAYDITQNSNVYAKYSKSYRSGGFNIRAPKQAFGTGFDPETMDAYEVGIKSDWLNHRLRVNAATFYYDYQDLQVDQNIPGSISDTLTLNAGEATVRGVELDISALLLDGLTFTASYGYLDAEYEDIRDTTNCSGVSQPAGTTVNVASCRTIPNAPQETYNLALDYIFPSIGVGEFSMRVGYLWQDTSNFTNATTAARGSFSLLDASLQLASVPVGTGQMRFLIWGKNLENKQYPLHAFDFGAIRLDTFNEPRSYGLDVSYEF